MIHVKFRNSVELGGSCIDILLGHDGIPGLTNWFNKLCFANSPSVYLYTYILPAIEAFLLHLFYFIFYSTLA